MNSRDGSVAYSVGPEPPEGVRRLHLNEYRFIHAPEVLAALGGAAAAPADALLTRYQSGPDSNLIGDLARYVRAPSRENILLAAGSDEVLRAIVDTSHLRGQRTLIMGEPGYTHFRHFAELRELDIITYAIGLQTTAAEHEAALRYHDDALRAGSLVYLCNPNNPTGDAWSAETVAALADAYPSSLFLIDEAYIEFTRDFGADSIAPVAFGRNNVVVTRTMSKAFGLAALRIGYAVGCAATLASIAIAVSPKAFSPLATSVARAAVLHADHYAEAAEFARREIDIVVRGLTALGWWAMDTPGNFYLVYVGDAAAAIATLAANGVQARNRDDLPGLAGFVRLTAGTAEDSRAVLDTFAAHLSPPTSVPPQTLYTRKGVVAEVKSLMKLAMRVLNEASVMVWAQSGTMLGMFRHKRRVKGRWRGGMIPWDDDGDLAYLRTAGRDPMAPLVATFAAAGLTLQRNRTDAYWQIGTNAVGAAISPVHVDVFSYSGDAATGYTLDDPRFANEEPNSPQAHCNTRYSFTELFPLDHSYTFYDVPIPMPAQSELVLRRSLGDDFMTVAKVRAGPDKLIAFELRDLSPA